MINKLSSGGIIATYQCQAACGHCLYGCSENAEAEYMTAKTAENVCAKLKKLGVRSLHIGGGEPFLNLDGLCELIKVIVSFGINIDYIETNAAWINGKNDYEKLLKVLEAGADCIMVSADPFHIEFIPFWKPFYLIKLLREMSISYFVWQERYIPFLSSLDLYKTYKNDELNQIVGYDIINECVSEYGMRFNGRALNLIRKTRKKKPYAEYLSEASCNELFNTGHFHVDPFSNYVPPGCTGMGIKTDDLDKEVDYKNYPIVSKLLTGGLKSLYELASEKGFIGTEYVSKCEFCFEMRKYLSDKEKYPDLEPYLFYKQNY